MNFKPRVPDTLTLLFFMMFAAWLATWMIPQGAFELSPGPPGRAMVVPGTFQMLSDPSYLSLWDFFKAIPRGFAAAQDVIFFVFIIGGVLAIVRATGTVDALIGFMLERFGNKPVQLIFVIVFAFAVASGSIGSAGEYIPFVLILVGLCRAMRMDAMAAVGIIVAGYGIGYGVAAFNPFTVVIAQQIAEVGTYSGWPLRLSILLPFVLIGVHHVWRYAKLVQDDPNRSMLSDQLTARQQSEGNFQYPKLNFKHRIILAMLIATFAVVVYGIAVHGWYLTELGAAFLVFGILAAGLGRLSPDQSAKHFTFGASELTSTALLVGFARCIALILEDGQVLHSIVYAVSTPLTYLGPELAATGMLVVQAGLNFFIPSGSGQAFVSIPLMAPVGDLLGIQRQVVVLAYQFGDGFTNMIIPTNAVLMGILGMAGVPYSKFLRFCMPLYLKLMAAAAVVVVLTVMFGEAWPAFFGTN